MKNKTKALIVVVTLLLVLAGFRFWFYSNAWGLFSATLHCDIGNVDVTVELERDDWFAISRIFNFNRYEENMYRCTVDEDLSITAGGTTYYIAQDGCSLIHVPGRDKCFHIDGDGTKLWEILEKYGVHWSKF